MLELIRLAPTASPTPARWLHWALGAQLAMVAVLARAGAGRTGTEPYRALGTPGAAAIGQRWW